MNFTSRKIPNSGKIFAVAAGMLGCAMVAYAASPADTPADTIAARQANFKQMGKGMKAISDQLKSPAPALDAIKAGAAAIDEAAGKVNGYFPLGSGPQPGVDTAALPAIWDKPDEFKADAAKLVTAAAALHAAADSGHLDQVQAQFTAVGGTCKECHQNFREQKN